MDSKKNIKQPLSAFLPLLQRITSTRLDLFGKGITYIDRLTLDRSFLNKIKEIDLSHNVLTKLDHIQQFQNLQILNISHNHIGDGIELEKLKILKRIGTILVKGNPFLKSKNNIQSAYAVLISKNTDIEILSRNNEESLQRLEVKENSKWVKKHYFSMLNLHIQFVNQFNIQSLEQANPDILFSSVFDEKVRELQSKSTLLKNIQAKGKIAEVGPFIVEQQEKVNNYLIQLNKKITQKQLILSNLKMKARERKKKEKTSKPHQAFIEKTEKKKHIASERKIQFDEKYSKQKFESTYSNLLMKHNPVYHLLFSPLHSLKPNEKDLLIERLSIDLKDKSHQVYKLQKVKQENLRLKIELKEKQKDFNFGEQKFHYYKTSMNQRLNLSEKLNVSCEEEIKSLKEKVKNLQEQGQNILNKKLFLENQISEKSALNLENQEKIKKLQKYDFLEQKIRIKRQENLKNLYLKRLCKKSSLFWKFQQTKMKNNAHENRMLLEVYFNQLKFQYKFQQFSQSFKDNKQKQIRETSFMIFVKQSILMKKEKALKIHLHLSYSQQFKKILKLKQVHKKINLQKCQKAKNHYEQRLLLNFYKIWFNHFEQEKGKNQNEIANEHFKRKVKQNVLKNWLIYVKEPFIKQIELFVKLRMKNQLNFMKYLQRQYLENKLIEGKFMNLIIFLHHTKRFKYFSLFKNNTIYQMDLLSQKYNRLEKHLRKNQLQEFCLISISLRQKTKTELLKETKINNLRKKNSLLRIQKREQTAKNKAIKFSNFLDKIKNNVIKISLVESLREFCLQDYLKKERACKFFSSLLSQHSIKKRRLEKYNKLKLYIVSKNSGYFKRKRQFLAYLAEPIKKRKMLSNFLARKYYLKMFKIFYQWKLSSYESIVLYYKAKIEQFGPEIEQISKRQRSTFEEKKMLMNIIDEKEKIIKKYAKQLQDSQIILKAKQQKYEKLQLYYHDAIQENESKSFSNYFSENRPEKDYDQLMLTSFQDHHPFGKFKPF